jgi:nicotinate-nucleotide adenylyltransferase
MNRRVGVYGGTFNPIHVGHLRAAEEVSEALDLERMLFVPSADPPHKKGPHEALAPAHDRLAWVERAVADNPRFAADPIEIDRGGRSYTVDTLRALADREDAELVFTVGRDAFAEIGTWREPETLFTLSHFCVTTRPPARKETLRELLPPLVRGAIELAPDGLSGLHREAGTWVRLLEITALDVSASEVRRRLRDGRSIRYLVPESVRPAIAASACYARDS